MAGGVRDVSLILTVVLANTVPVVLPVRAVKLKLSVPSVVRSLFKVLVTVYGVFFVTEIEPPNPLASVKSFAFIVPVT